MTEADYYRHRAQRHRALAEAATHPSARAAHTQLAAAYAARAQGVGERRG